MVVKLAIGLGLMAACVVIHAVGVMSAVRWLRRRQVPPRQFWPWVWLFILVAGWVIALHVIEITVWALVYAWADAIPGIQQASYFSAVTYTTTGYGDLVLPQDWRLVGAIEALTGILMCGLSTGFFFALFSKVYKDQ